jgi:hypothetical protein
MKSILLAVAMMMGIAAGPATAGGLSPAAENETAKPGVVVTDVLEVKATLDAIDHKKRTITLKGIQGKAVTLRADKAVRNFEQLKKGDMVLVDFVESVAISIRSARAPQSPGEARLVSVAPKGAKVGVLLSETFVLSAVIESVDPKARQVTLKEPNGGYRMVPVDKSMKNIERFKKGEDVVLRVTEPIAIRVERRK